MKITINDHRKIFAVQEAFSSMFPYLRIEFLAKPEKRGAPASKKVVKHSSKTIGECRVQHNKGTITITPNMTVADLEETFRDVYGLSVIILRRSGRAWLEIALTNSWSLERQNTMGKELSYAEDTDENQAAE